MHTISTPPWPWFVLFAILTFALSSCSDKPSSTHSNHPISPDFTLKPFNATPFTLKQQAGHPVIINFFTSWCHPCGDEAPILETAYQELKPQGVVFVGVVGQDTERNAKQFIQKHHITFPTGLDTTGKIMATFEVYGMPTTLFIDPTGHITARHIGTLSKVLIQQELDKMQ